MKILTLPQIISKDCDEYSVQWKITRTLTMSSGGLYQPWKIWGSEDLKSYHWKLLHSAEHTEERLIKSFTKLLQFLGSSQKLSQTTTVTKVKWVNLKGSSESFCKSQVHPHVSCKKKPLQNDFFSSSEEFLTQKYLGK